MQRTNDLAKGVYCAFTERFALVGARILHSIEFIVVHYEADAFVSGYEQLRLVLQNASSRLFLAAKYFQPLHIKSVCAVRLNLYLVFLNLT